MGKRTTKRATAGNDYDDDVYNCTLHFGALDAARAFLTANNVDLVETAEAEGRHRLIAFLTKKQIAAFRKAGHDVDVGENVSATGRARQKEVAKGDRFKGGRIAPKSLGIAEERAR